MMELVEIIILSIIVSGGATIIASLLAVPIGIYVSIKDFPFKKMFKRIVYTMMSLPPVVLGLIVLLLLSRKGPLGFLGLLFSVEAMIIAQVLLILPIIIGNIITSSEELSKKILETSKTLGGGTKDFIKLIIQETKPFIITAITLGFSRAISEVGAVILVGGNIRGETRVMTTYIALSNSMGDFTNSIIMGGVLLIIAFLVNTVLERYRR